MNRPVSTAPGGLSPAAATRTKRHRPPPPLVRSARRQLVYLRLVKILYGVVGEGMGHAMRSQVVLSHLVAQGHRCDIMTSGRAVAYLRRRFSGVNEIHGLHIISEANKVRRGRTLWSNIVEGAAGIPKNIGAYFEQLDEARPDIVISDFESWTYLYAKVHGLPVISVDNMQALHRCKVPKSIISGHRADFEVARNLVKGKVPFCDHYLISCFVELEVRKPRTSLFPPILRAEILEARSSPRWRDGDHLLVYQTAEGYDDLVQALHATGLECRIYGMRRDLTEDLVEGNLVFKPFSEDGFIADLAGAKAVVASAGFTLMGEAVYLRKPMLAVPLKGQFEQIFNARLLTESGYGCWAEEVRADSLAQLLDSVDRFRESLEAYDQDGNQALVAAVDEHLDRAAAGVY